MQFDLVLRNGRVFDGSGAPPVAGDRIAAIDRVPAGRGDVEIDVRGQAIAPGFIDVHTHDDRALLTDPDMPAKTSQGVTDGDYRELRDKPRAFGPAGRRADRRAAGPDAAPAGTDTGGGTRWLSRRSS